MGTGGKVIVTIIVVLFTLFMIAVINVSGANLPIRGVLMIGAYYGIKALWKKKDPDNSTDIKLKK